LAPRQKLPKHRGTEKRRTLQKIAGFLERLPNPNLAQQLQDGTLRIGYEWSTLLIPKWAHAQKPPWILLEEPLPMVAASRKALDKPRR